MSSATSSPDGDLLAGVRVLDLSTVGPAARATRVLGDYGASVVKVGPVPSVGTQPITPPYFAYSGHRGMARVEIDLKSESGREAFLALVADADVVVESFRPGVLDRMGLGYERLREENEGIVLCSTSGYGQDGPSSQRAGHDVNYLAAGGFLATSEPRGDGGPPLPGATIADAAAGGLHAALAVTAALVGRASTGRGCHLDVSIADGVLWLMSRSEKLQHNLRSAAETHNIDPSRLIFASRVPLIEDHLARYRQADLVLDTHPYNAHPTAADALMAGLPVLTYMGNAFPARVAGSLLHAAGLPELITHSFAEYEALALRLGKYPEELAALKARLRGQRADSRLFGTEEFCRNLEAVYFAMWRQTQLGERAKFQLEKVA